MLSGQQWIADVVTLPVLQADLLLLLLLLLSGLDVILYLLVYKYT